MIIQKSVITSQISKIRIQNVTLSDKQLPKEFNRTISLQPYIRK